MKKQDYQHHIRFYTLHHFVFYPVLLILIILCVRGAFTDPARSFEWIAFTIGLLLILWLSLMLRQHYALTGQNRTVRLEMRLRYYQLTHERFEVFEQQMSFGQIAALRFASDGELPALTRRAVQENLSPDDIKKSIRQWLPDHMRV